MGLTCRFLVEQLRQRLTHDVGIAARAGQAARDAARSAATAMEKKQDSRMMIEQGNLAHAQALRVEQARGAIAALDSMLAAPHQGGGPATVRLGSIVDAVTEDETGEHGRTFVVLPVGAGEELHGPDGDGIITVITPSSPVGRAMMGKGPGHVAEVVIRGEPVDWEILAVS